MIIFHLYTKWKKAIYLSPLEDFHISLLSLPVLMKFAVLDVVRISGQFSNCMSFLIIHIMPVNQKLLLTMIWCLKERNWEKYLIDYDTAEYFDEVSGILMECSHWPTPTPDKWVCSPFASVSVAVGVCISVCQCEQICVL